MEVPAKATLDWRQVLIAARTAVTRVLTGGLQALRAAGVVLAHVWRLTKPVLRIGLQILLALIIVFEEWGWRPLAELLGRFARWRPWAQIEYAIVRLPPYAALLAFVLPSALLLPLKFLALFLVANGQFLLAALLFAGAKVVATALVARLFLLTQPALMQIGWFAWAYDRVMPWKEALTDYVRLSVPWRMGRLWKERTRRAILIQYRRWRPTLLDMRAVAVLATARLRIVARRSLRQIRARLTASQRP